jgi:hypothetical protein
MKLILSIFMIFPASAFANDCPGFLNYVKANSQLKQHNNSQIQCFMTRPPKQHTKVFTFSYRLGILSRPTTVLLWRWPKLREGAQKLVIWNASSSH